MDEKILTFETVMRVRSTETDFGHHMTMQALTATFIEAMKRFFYSRGIEDINTSYQGLVVNNINISNISFARAREELLYEVGIRDLTKDGGNIIIKVSRMFDASVVANATIHFVNYDYHLHQVIALTQPLIDALDTKSMQDDPDNIFIL